MAKKWLILAVIILIYLPVSIDATVLHVAIPRLSVGLGASNNELLWIIDIYSLVMAGLLLPMGALGDRIGYKRLTLLGTGLFGVASLCAALSTTAMMLIISRAFLGIGAAMILPATLSGVRQTFPERKERDFALGLWVAVGTGGAMIGPIVGGFLLEHFYWGSVFMLNVPIVLMTLLLTHFLIPQQPIRKEQPLYLGQATALTVSLLLLIFVAKSLIHPTVSGWLIFAFALIGLWLFRRFVQQQLQSSRPMLDISLLTNRTLLLGVMMALTPMIAMIGFELLMAQELQFVIGKSPLEAGLFMLPLMIASGIAGPIAGKLSAKVGIRSVALTGMLLSAISFWGLSITNFSTQPLQAGFWMVILGLGASSVFFAATSTIMASSPPEKASAAGAIEGMAYELGAGFGVAIFGLLLAGIYTSHISLPTGLTFEQTQYASDSISEAVQIVDEIGGQLGEQVMQAAKTAFSSAHSVVLKIISLIFVLLAFPIWRHKQLR